VRSRRAEVSDANARTPRFFTRHSSQNGSVADHALVLREGPPDFALSRKGCPRRRQRFCARTLACVPFTLGCVHLILVAFAVRRRRAAPDHDPIQECRQDPLYSRKGTRQRSSRFARLLLIG
jgi:hypothetical protein